MGSPKSLVLSKDQLEALYRSNVRQRTRAGLGTIISSGLAGSGFVYMVAPALVAAHGFDKAETARDQLSEIINAHGYRPRKRDKLAGVLVGSVEKAALAFITLGHEDLAHLGTVYDLDPAVLQAHADWLAAGGDGPLTYADGTPVLDAEGKPEVDQGALGEGNEAYNSIVDTIKDAFHVENGLPQTGEQVVGTVLAAGAAAGIEYATNQAGHVGRVGRAEVEMPEVVDGQDGRSMGERLGI